MTDILDKDGIGSGLDLKVGSSSDSELSRALIAARHKGGLMVVDHNFKVVMIDRQAASFCCLSPGQSQGKRFYCLFPSLLGSLFAGQLHEVVTLHSARRCGRPTDNELLDQFAQTFSDNQNNSELLVGISMRAYTEGSSTYGLIQLKIQNAVTANASIHKPDAKKYPAASPSQARSFIAADDALPITTDCYGFISAISQSAQAFFGYREELIQGSSARVLLPGLDGLEGMNISEAVPLLSAQHSQGYIVAATSEGETKALDIQLFNCADDGDEMILLCRDCTTASRKAEELINRGNLFDLTFASVADGVLMVDSEGFVTEMNPIAEQLLGIEMDRSKALQIQSVMPLANEETGISVAPVQDALTQAINVEVTQSLLLKIRGAEPMSVAVSAFPLRDSLGRVKKCLVIFRPLSEARRVSSRLNWQSKHDTLTGLPNRNFLADKIQRAIESAKREGVIHALLYIDLYNFSVINDTSGHMAGDELLKQFARLLLDVKGPSDFVARIGNDEFALLLHCVNYDRAMALAEQILDVIKEFSIPWEGEVLKVGASIGGILVDNEALSDIDLMISAGSSCAAARDKGRNKIHFQSFNEEVAKRRSLATSMPKIVSALDEDRFTLFAQPITALNRGIALPKYYEILVRMRDSDGTILQPSEFIPVAEHFSPIDDLDKWVFKNALKFLLKLESQGLPLPTLSVNLSGSTVGDENAIDYILVGFSNSGISPRHIQFEITETAAVKHLQEAKRLIATLRSVGATFALDDLGSGLSSFAYLKELPIDCLKIDSSFIQTMDNSEVDYSVVSTINHLGHIMGVATVAEGVEKNSVRVTEENRRRLHSGILDCTPQAPR